MISIIIPVLNEEHNILNLLSSLESNASGLISEIIIVDGGSSDRTTEILKNLDSVIVISSEKGRAKQMNAGAAIATSNILYFLHVDSIPPKDFDKYIYENVLKGNEAGCFCMKFDYNHWWLNLMGWLTKINHKTCRGGDQSLFISKNLFEEIGGFDEDFMVYEDNDIIKKLYAINQFTVIQKWIITSARRYKHYGIWKVQYHFFLIYYKKWRGANPQELLQYYKSVFS